MNVRFDRDRVVLRVADEGLAAALRGIGGALLDAREDMAGPPLATWSVARLPEGYALDPGSGASKPLGHSAAEAADALLTMAVRTLMARRDDLLWLHAAVMSHDGLAVMLCGKRGAGKSTLVHALSRHGWEYLSDEFGAIDPQSLQALPFPIAPFRRLPTAGPASEADPEMLGKEAVDVTVANTPALLAAIYLITYESRASRLEVGRCSPAEGVLALLSNSLNDGQPRDVEVARLCEVAARCEVRRASYRDAESLADRIRKDLSPGRPDDAFVPVAPAPGAG